LNKTPIEQLINNDRPLVSLNIEKTTTEAALQILAHNHVQSAVGFDEAGNKSFITVQDILKYILLLCWETQPTDSIEWDNWVNDLEGLHKKGNDFGKTLLSDALSGFKNDLHPIHKSTPLIEVIQMFSQGSPRAAIQIGSNNHVDSLGVVSASAVNRFLAQNIHYLPPNIANRTIGSLEPILNSTNRPFMTLPRDATSIHTFYLMVLQHADGVGVIDEEAGKLVGHMSVSDIKGITKDTFQHLLLDVISYQAKHGIRGKQPLVVCQVNSTLEALIMKLSLCNVHLIWIINEEGLPLGIITLQDVLSAIVKLCSA